MEMEHANVQGVWQMEHANVQGVWRIEHTNIQGVCLLKLVGEILNDPYTYRIAGNFRMVQIFAYFA